MKFSHLRSKCLARDKAKNDYLIIEIVADYFSVDRLIAAALDELISRLTEKKCINNFDNRLMPKHFWLQLQM